MSNPIISPEQAFALAEIPRRTEAEWVEIIRADLGRTVEGIIAAGTHLTQAKFQVGHGRFLPLLESIGIHEKTAERLMRIAANPVLTNPTHGSKLPTSMRTLAELAKLPPNVLEAKIIEGKINPKTERKEVDHIRREAAGTPPKKPQQSKQTKLTEELARVEEDNARLLRAGEDLFAGKDSAADITEVIVARLLFLLTPAKARAVLDLLPEVYARRLAELEADQPKPKPAKKPTRRRRKGGPLSEIEADLNKALFGRGKL